MKSTDQVHFQIYTNNVEIDARNRNPCNFKPLTFEKLSKWIDTLKVSDEVKEELKKSAGNYPHQALSNWKKNYTKHLAKAQAKFRKSPKPKKEKNDEEG